MEAEIMQITRLVKRLGRTIGLPNFSSVRFDEEIEVKLEPGEDFVEAEQKLYDKVAQMLANDIERMRKAKKNGQETEE